MTDEAMSPLRRRMIEDMTIRKLSPKTQQGDTRTVLLHCRERSKRANCANLSSS
jgi:hypothetical protein